MTSQLASIRISSSGQVVTAQPCQDDTARQYEWEQGQVDYLGVDKFENIQKHLDKVMTEPPPALKEDVQSPFNL